MCADLVDHRNLLHALLCALLVISLISALSWSLLLVWFLSNSCSSLFESFRNTPLDTSRNSDLLKTGYLGVTDAQCTSSQKLGQMEIPRNKKDNKTKKEDLNRSIRWGAMQCWSEEETKKGLPKKRVSETRSPPPPQNQFYASLKDPFADGDTINNNQCL